MKFLVTGAAGFIGFFTSSALLSLGHKIVGIDNLNDYYDITLKHDRLNQIKHKNFKFIECDLINKDKVDNIFESAAPIFHALILTGPYAA